MENFLIAALISIGLVMTCVAVFYEIMAHVWLMLPRLEGRPRTQILLTVLAAFAGHTVAVWAFGLVYYLFASYLGFGSLDGRLNHELIDYVYFSVICYSSLGLSDVYPLGGLQMLVGIESILGLILTGWTVTFTYIVTEKYIAHRKERHTERRKMIRRKD